jgi:hypothetical protein
MCTDFTKGQANVHEITNAVISIITSTVRLEQLELRTAGSLDKSVIPCFGSLQALRDLTLSNSADEERMPLYVHFRHSECLAPVEASSLAH